MVQWIILYHVKDNPHDWLQVFDGVESLYDTTQMYRQKYPKRQILKMYKEV